MQARAPDEGPSGSRTSASETGGQPVPQDVEIEERYEPDVLRVVAEAHNIDSTRSLVAVYNESTNEDERAVLLGWLRKYHERWEDCLMPKAVLEYAELASIVPRSTNAEIIVKNLIGDLCFCIFDESFLAPSFAAAVHLALVHVNPSPYSGVSQLLFVARKLLGCLSATPKLTRENFSVHRGTFLALQQTLFLLLKGNHGRINKREKQRLRQAIAKKKRTLRLSCKHYPVYFYFEALRRAVDRLEVGDAVSSHLTQEKPRIYSGFVHVFHFLRTLASNNSEEVQRACTEGRVSVGDVGTAKRPWFDSFRDLMAARLEAAEDKMKIDLFWSVCSITIENQQNMENSANLKALRFGIIHELSMLAIEGSSESTRIEATIGLSDLATQQAISEGWIDDDDIFITLLDVIHEVHKIGQCKEKTTEALEALYQSCEGFARGALMVWLDGESMEDKLQAESPLAAQQHKDLFIKICRDVDYNPFASTDSKEEELKKRYLRNDFATVLRQKH